MRYPSHLLKLIDVLRKLPGVGSKSAERFAFELLQWPEAHLEEMSKVIREIPQQLKQCPECGCLKGEGLCPFCDPRRVETGSLCVIVSPKDAFAIEATHEYRGLYHVLGGVLSPMEGFHTDSLSFGKLKERIMKFQLSEVVIALDSTLEGDATALYLKNELESLNIHTTRLAFGLPMGSSLDYVDGGTLARAFIGRSRF